MRRLTENRLPVLVVAGLLALGIAVPMSGGELGFGAGSSVPSGVPASPSGPLGAAGSPSPVATATAEPDSRTPGDGQPRPDAGSGPGRDRAGHPVPVAGHGDEPQRGRARAGRDQQPL